MEEVKFKEYIKNFKNVLVYKNYINNDFVEKDVLDIHKIFPLDLILTYGEDDVIRAARKELKAEQVFEKKYLAKPKIYTGFFLFK